MQPIKQDDFMVLCKIDSNAIIVAMRMIKAYLSLIDRLKEAGIKPKHQVSDNEAS